MADQIPNDLDNLIKLIQNLLPGDESTIRDQVYKRSIGIRQLEYMLDVARLDKQATLNRELVRTNLDALKQKLNANPTQ